MMTTTDSKEHWMIDKKVPAALIFAIFMQGVVGVWWASDITSRLESIESAEAGMEENVESLVKLSDARYEKIIRLEEQLAATKTILGRIESKIDGFVGKQ